MNRNIMLCGLFLLTLALAGPAAADDHLKGTPGHIDLEWIEIPSGAGEVQDIELGAVLLGIAASQEHEDEALLKALNMIQSVRVKSWSMDGDDDHARKAVDKVAKMLEKDGWKRLIYVKDDEETVTVSTRYEDGRMVGIMLVTYEPGDAVAFVNVVGDLDIATMLKLAREFDGDSLEDMLGELEGHVEVH